MDTKSTILEQILLEKKYWPIRHVLFWVFIYLDEFLGLIGITPPLEYPVEMVVEMVVDMVLVYLNLYILIPGLLLRKKIWLYLLYTLFSIILVIIADHWIYGSLDIEEEFIASMLINTGLSTVGVLSLAIAIKIFKQNYVNRKRIDELQTLNLKTELAYLKNQVNPHFLFNALNTIYVQSKQYPILVPNAILNLSDLLRYQIYDSQKEKISLKQEVEYLQNYIQLETSRRDNYQVNFEIEGQVTGKQISPLLFLPLVENAFKYSETTSDEKSHVSILLSIQENNLRFNISNSLGREDKYKVPGIGLANLRRRLELLYPERHALTIDKGDNNFVATLNITLA